MNLSTATPNAPLQYTVFNAGFAFNAPGADFVLTNSATAAFSQDISIVATGAISPDSITARLVPGAGVTSSSSSGYIILTGSTISVPNGLDSSIDPGVTSYRNSASVILTSTLGDIVAGPINASTPSPQIVAVPAYRVLISSKGAVSLGTVNTSGPTAAGGIIISSFGNASCASIAAGGLVPGSIAGVTVVSTGGLISIPGGISTTESVSARITLYQTLPIDLQAASGVSTGSLVTSSPFTNNNAGSVTISTTATGGLTCNLIITSASPLIGPAVLLTSGGPLNLGYVSGTATATVTINAPTLALAANAGVFAGTLNFTTPASRNLRIVTGAVDPTSNIVDPTVLAALAPHVSTVSLGASGSGVMTLESPRSTTVALSFLTALTTTSTISVTSPATVTYNALTGNGTQIGASASFAGSITPGLGGALGTLTFENVAAKASSSSTLNIAIAPTPQGGFDSLDFIGGSLNLNNETLALTFPQGVAPNSTYPIIELDGTALTGTFRGLANNAAVNAYGAIILHIEYTPTAVQIVSTPEPHWLATAVPAMVLLRRRRM